MTRKWLLLIGLTLVTVVVWIVLEISIGAFSEESTLEYEHYVAPISPSFNEEALQEVLDREENYLIIERDALE